MKGLVVGMGANLCVCVSVRVPEHRVHWVVSAPFIVVLIRNDNKERCNFVRDAFFSNNVPILVARMTLMLHPIIHSFHIDDINVR